MKSVKKSTYPFLESIGVYEGQAPLLPYHQARVDRTFAAFYPGQNSLDLLDLWQKASFPSEKVKWRIQYNALEQKAEICAFPERKIEYLQVVTDDTIAHAYKFTERDRLGVLYREKAEPADEILIIRNCLLTDAYYYNAVVKIGAQLLTPRKPRLAGVMRAYCLGEGLIQPADIRLEDLAEAKGVYLINALHPLERAAFIEQEHMIWE